MPRMSTVAEGDEAVDRHRGRASGDAIGAPLREKALERFVLEEVVDDEDFDRRQNLTRKSRMMRAMTRKKPMIIIEKPGDEKKVCHVINSAVRGRA